MKRNYVVLGVILLVFLVLATQVYAQKIVRYWTFIDPKGKGPREEALAKAIALFEKKNPDLRVVVDVVPPPQIPVLLIQSTPVGKGPDVARIADVYGIGEQVEAGTILPLDEFVANWTEEQKKDFLGDWNATVFEGKKYSLPLEFRTAVLYYRKDYLEEAGVKVPETWDEVCEVGKKLKTVKGERILPFVIGLSERRRATAFAEFFPPMIWAAGGEIFNEKGEAIFNDKAGVRAFQTLRKLALEWGVMPKEVIGFTYDEVFDGVRAGTMAMNILGSHRVVAVRAAGKLGDKLQTAMAPGYEPGKPTPAMLFGWNLVIGSNTKDKKAAWKWIEHLLSNEIQKLYAIAGEVPSRRSTYRDPWFGTPEARDTMQWREYMDKHGRSFKFPKDFTPLAEWVCLAAQKIITDPTVSIKTELDEVVKKYNELIKK